MLPVTLADEDTDVDAEVDPVADADDVIVLVLDEVCVVDGEVTSQL